MAFQEFSKNYINISIVPPFEHFLFHHFCLTYYISFIFKWSTFRIIRNINNSSIIFYRWLIYGWIIDWHYYINVFSMAHFFIVYFTYKISKWSTIVNYYIFVSIIRSCCCSCVSNCYSSFTKYVRVIIIT